MGFLCGTNHLVSPKMCKSVTRSRCENLQKKVSLRIWGFAPKSYSMLFFKYLNFRAKLFWLTYPIEGGWVIGNRVEWNFEKINLFPIVFWQKPTEFISVWWGEIQNIIFNSLVLKEKWDFLNWAREAEGRPSEASLILFFESWLFYRQDFGFKTN